MQVMEAEIVLRLKYKARLKSALLFQCIMVVFFVSFYSWLIVSSFRMTASPFSDLQEAARQDVMIFLLVGFLVLFCYVMYIAFVIRQLRAPDPYVRISHQGIFTSRDPFLITWAEIQELSLATFLGVPYLRIVPRNVQEVAARAKAASRASVRFGIALNLLFFRFSKSSAPIGFPQTALPISLDELFAVIQEHFGTQLREHRILVRSVLN